MAKLAMVAAAMAAFAVAGHGVGAVCQEGDPFDRMTGLRCVRKRVVRGAERPSLATADGSLRVTAADVVFDLYGSKAVSNLSISGIISAIAATDQQVAATNQLLNATNTANAKQLSNVTATLSMHWHRARMPRSPARNRP